MTGFTKNAGDQPAPPVAKIDIIKWVELLSAILLTALVLFFLIMRATHAGALWRDEAAAVQLAQMPRLSDVAANFQHEAFPLPFPLLVRGYTALFGATDASLRCFGLIIGVAMLAVAWFNSRSFGDRPLLFLSLFGLNATFLIWGNSLRGYGLGCVLLLLTLGLAAKAIRQPTITNAIVATITSIASVQIIVNAVILTGAIAVSAFVVFLIQRRVRQAIIVCMFAAMSGLSFLPYAKSYLGADWTVLLKYQTTFFSLWEKLRLAIESQHLTAGLFWYVTAPLVLVGAIWRCWKICREKSSECDMSLFLIAVSMLSIFAYYAFLKILSYAAEPWYYLPLLCVIAGAIDLLSATLARVRWIRIARLLFVITALMILPFTLWQKVRERMSDIDLVTTRLQRYAAADDLIIVNPCYLGPSFSWYYHGQTRWLTLPELSEKRIHRYDLIRTKMEEADPLGDIRSAISQTLQAGNRVWLVGGAQPPDTTGPMSLPRPPDPRFGWNNQAYVYAWSTQLGAFLKEHVTDGELVVSPAPGVGSNENIPLMVARGWRE